MSCAYLPGQREMERTQRILGTIDSVAEVHFTCGGSLLANDTLCTDVVMKDGSRLRFDHVGFNAFGTTAVNVYVAQADGLVPRIASCDKISTPNFHRDSVLGHHFRPMLIDMKDAVFRYREVLEEVQYWPQCPQSWAIQDKQGTSYRYCARPLADVAEPPKPERCP